LLTLSAHLEEADTDRNEMALWMYSLGSTGRPKDIVHLHYVMVYTDQSFAKHAFNYLRLTSASRYRNVLRLGGAGFHAIIRCVMA
jgi:acyl-coenzyme A synthetase/AMP-(fatty) acid ligase